MKHSNETTAVIMGIDAPAYILRTNDGENNWQVVFKDITKGMFLDAMEFWNEQAGIVIGDPINGKFLSVVHSTVAIPGRIYQKIKTGCGKWRSLFCSKWCQYPQAIEIRSYLHNRWACKQCTCEK
ncbi:MAG: hypothetical protein H7Y86_03815 [Rhizobacter sp.]|nr:hypothetical protein [Ferruginibacter sp.]